MRVRADEIKEGDKLPNGQTVWKVLPDDADYDDHHYIATDEGRDFLVPDWMEVEVERPEPTVTVTVTLPAEVADFVAERWTENFLDLNNPTIQALAILGRAATRSSHGTHTRRARMAQTTPRRIPARDPRPVTDLRSSRY